MGFAVSDEKTETMNNGILLLIDGEASNVTSYQLQYGYLSWCREGVCTCRQPHLSYHRESSFFIHCRQPYSIMQNLAEMLLNFATCPHF